MPFAVCLGQHIRATRWFGYHHGIVMPSNRGVPMVAELSKPSQGGRVRMVTLEKFAKGGEVSVVLHSDGVPHWMVVDNVNRLMGRQGYHLLDWNCEHFATWCSTYRAESEQINGLGRAAIVLAGLLLLAKLAA